MVEALINDKELCHWLRISRATSAKMRGRDLPYYVIGSVVRYSKQEVQEWLDRHQHELGQEDLPLEDEIEDTEDHEGQDDSSDEGPADPIREANVEWHNQ
jgi:predicted DNA-binding transcriptional regulator AlpA